MFDEQWFDKLFDSIKQVCLQICCSSLLFQISTAGSLAMFGVGKVGDVCPWLAPSIIADGLFCVSSHRLSGTGSLLFCSPCPRSLSFQIPHPRSIHLQAAWDMSLCETKWHLFPYTIFQARAQQRGCIGECSRTRGPELRHPTHTRTHAWRCLIVIIGYFFKQALLKFWRSKINDPFGTR